MWHQTCLPACSRSRALRVHGLQTHPLPATWLMNISNRINSPAVSPRLVWTLGPSQDCSAWTLSFCWLETPLFLLGEKGFKATFSLVKQKTPFTFFLMGSVSANEILLFQASSAILLEMFLIPPEPVHAALILHACLNRTPIRPPWKKKKKGVACLPQHIGFFKPNFSF